jgi:hypothetical protein
MVSDRLLEAIGIFNLRMFEPDVQENVLTSINQAAELLHSKNLFTVSSAGVKLTEWGTLYQRFSPLYLWKEVEISERAAQFLAEAAARVCIEIPLDLFVMMSPRTILVKDLFAELDWDFSLERWRLLKSELLRWALIEPVRSIDEIEIRITGKGMIFASYAD